MKDFFQAKLKPVGILYFKNLQHLVLLVLLPIVIIVGITIYSVSQFVHNNIDRYAAQSLNNYQQSAYSLFSRYYMQAAIIGIDPDVQMFFLHSPDSEIYYNKKSISKLITNITSVDTVINSVYLHSVYNGQVYSERGIYQRKSFYDPEALIDYQEYLKTARSWILYRENAEGVPLISYYQPVGSSTMPTGVIIINFDLRKFGNQMAPLAGDYDSALFIVDENGTPLRALFGQSDISAPSFEICQKLFSGRTSCTGNRCTYYTAPISYTNWNFILAISSDPTREMLFDILTPILLILLMVILFILILTFFTSLKLYSPIRSIMKMLINTVPEYADLKEDHPEEEAFISAVIDNTIAEKNLIGKELEAQIQTLKTAQSIALQSQINPHFFYNTLDSINWTAMALTKGQNDVSRMLTKLASMMRYSLEEVNTLVPFEKELTHARDYLELQALCYGDRFSVTWDVQPEVLQYPIIKIVLQPILENALAHGIKPMPSQKKGLISISAAYAKEGFRITISDNGVGMTSDAVAELNNSFLSDDIREKAHIGLMNVDQRIRLILGKSYGLSVSSVLGEGTVVTCHLPPAPDKQC